MKLLPILAAAAAATLAVPAATAVAAPAAPVAAPAAAKAEFQHHRRSYWRTVCTTKWRHHRKVRVCRKVRAWR
jgi:hypothetical protein